MEGFASAKKVDATTISTQILNPFSVDRAFTNEEACDRASPRALISKMRTRVVSTLPTTVLEHKPAVGRPRSYINDNSGPSPQGVASQEQAL